MTWVDDILSKVTGKCHPACLLLPEMSDAEFRDLIEDIREHGQRRPILVDKDSAILDGRHRYRALVELGTKPRYEILCNMTEASKVALIISENIHRRHLTTQQRAAVAAELAGKLAEAAKDRQLAGKAAASNEAKGKATEQAAKMVGGVSRASVERAQKRMRTDPAAHAQAKAGKLPRKKSMPRRIGPTVAGRIPMSDGSVGYSSAPIAAATGSVRAAIGQPKQAPPPTWPDLTSLLRRLLSVCCDGDAADWADRMTGEVRRDTVGKIRELRGRLLILEEALAAAKQVSWPKPALVVTPEPDVAEQADTDLDGLRAWAQTIGLERLVKHVEAVPSYKEKSPDAKIQAFLNGVAGGYHLHRALKTVRADLGEYTQIVN